MLVYKYFSVSLNQSHTPSPGFTVLVLVRVLTRDGNITSYLTGVHLQYWVDIVVRQTGGALTGCPVVAFVSFSAGQWLEEAAGRWEQRWALPSCGTALLWTLGAGTIGLTDAMTCGDRKWRYLSTWLQWNNSFQAG